MKLWSVFRFSISSVACVGLLMACGDRGQFKAYQYTKEQMAENKAKADAKNPPPPAPSVETGTPDTSATDEFASGPSLGGDAGGDGSAATGAAGQQGAATDSATSTTGAPAADQSAQLFTTIDQATVKEFQEEGQSISPEPEQQVAANTQLLNVFIDEAVKDQTKVNQTAAGLIKGITVLPGGTEGQRIIDIQAIVVIGGEELVFDASGVPVKKYQDTESVPNILFKLKKPCAEEEIAARNSLWTLAKCADDECTKIQVLMSFDIGGDQRTAGVFIVENKAKADGQMEWQFTATNVGRPKTFEEVQPTCSLPDNGGGQAPNPEASVPMDSTTSETSTAGSVPAAQTTAAPLPQLSYGPNQPNLSFGSGTQLSFGAQAPTGTLQQRMARTPYTMPRPTAAPAAAQSTQSTSPQLSYGPRQTGATAMQPPGARPQLSFGAQAPTGTLQQRMAKTPYTMSRTTAAPGATQPTQSTSPQSSYGSAQTGQAAKQVPETRQQLSFGAQAPPASLQQRMAKMPYTMSTTPAAPVTPSNPPVGPRVTRFTVPIGRPSPPANPAQGPSKQPQPVASAGRAR